jgi:hypothetical protein
MEEEDIDYCLKHNKRFYSRLGCYLCNRRERDIIMIGLIITFLFTIIALLFLGFGNI